MGRAIKDHRRAIRERYGFHHATLKDQDRIRKWLLNAVLPDEYRPAYLQEAVYKHLQEKQLEPPSRKQIERLVTSLIHQYQEALINLTLIKLPLLARLLNSDLKVILLVSPTSAFQARISNLLS